MPGDIFDAIPKGISQVISSRIPVKFSGKTVEWNSRGKSGEFLGKI